MSLIKISAKGKVIAVNTEYKFHHSLEIDNQGNIYAPILTKDNYPGGADFREEGFAILDKNLKVLKVFLLSEIYENSPFNYKIFSVDSNKDPFHLNDVAPLYDSEETKVDF